MTTRISTLTPGYSIGSLSAFPLNLDDKETLYEAKNNAQTVMKQSLSFNGKYIIVDNNDSFPTRGLIRLGPPPGKAGNYEIIYYGNKNEGVFYNLVRGFVGSRQTIWPATTTVSHSVMAEHHNALRDAIHNIETDLGTNIDPTTGSLNGILKRQENIFLAPKAIFRASKIIGQPPLKVRFQNFSTGPLVRYLWDFGDGATSVEKNPTHTYQSEGIYTVQLNIVSILGAQGITTKSNYITVSKQEINSFFYVTPRTGYSLETANAMSIDPTEFRIIDQTDGDIVQRYWIFGGDGTVEGIPVANQSYQENNPNKHEIKFIFDKPGDYRPGLMTILETSTTKRTFLSESIVVQ